jgi:hypothetical protein
MEDRKIAMEIRRRKKDEKNRALEAQVQGMKRKAKGAEDWYRKKDFLLWKVLPFCVVLAMLCIGTVLLYSKLKEDIDFEDEAYIETVFEEN